MTNPTLERAARAAYEARGPKLSIPRMGVRWATWDEIGPDTKANEIAAVRAVLQSIREPDEGMTDAGTDVIAPHYTPPTDQHMGQAFTAMIDHILKDGEP